jgi:transforming growth factor-beta-induced protein
LFKKGFCISNLDIVASGPVTVKCPETEKPNIVELAESVKDLSTLVSAVVAGDLVDTLSSPGPFTVFAPTNEAFAALPAGTLDSLMKPENKAELADILTYHVLPVQAFAKDLEAFQAVKTVEGKSLHIQKWGGVVKVGPSLESKDLRTVTGADNAASNGVAHIIDGVLIPPQSTLLSHKPNIVELAESVKDLSALVSAVVAADLVDTLSGKGPFTVFAPTNEAFAALPPGTLDDLMKPESKAKLTDLLTYHVLAEQILSSQLKASQTVTTLVNRRELTITKDRHGVIVGNQKVSSADNLASNGVVHIIDGVLSPPSSKPNIVELAESVKDLSTLVSAVVAADLADTLSSPGPFTVFAPTNEAFAALPPGTLDDLMKPESKATLADILTYHVLSGQFLVKDLDLFQPVKTVEGKPLHIQKWGGAVQVGPSLTDLKHVTGADNIASNGAVHIIDGVLLPPSSVMV